MLTDETFLEEYRTGTHNFVNDFYKKAFSQSIEYCRAVGYFRSSSLEAFGSTLQGFLHNKGKIKLITSIELTESDNNAIKKGITKQEICEKRINSIIENEFKENIGNGITKLTKLLEIGRLTIKIALPKSGRGIYHEKVGLFFDKNNNYIAFSGSANESKNAFENNYECIEVFTSWNEKSRAEKKKIHFESLWNNTNNNVFIFDFSEASKKRIIQKVKEVRPIDYGIDILKSPDDLGDYNKNKSPSLPDWLEVRDYQKEAYNKWKENNFYGILSMATGTGKTITAFYSLIKLLHQEERLATVVVVPYQHLVTQWEEEAKSFGIKFILCFENSKKWSSTLLEAITRYKYGEEKYLFIITTTSTYILPKFQDPILKLDNLCMVVDEAHNFGSPQIRKRYLSNANFRLGLSATPIRHMDEEGTEALFEYLGEIIYEFSLEQAIKMRMLTPYKYYPVLVYLTKEEQKEYLELTQKIIKLSVYEDENSKEILKIMLLKRAKIISSAQNKIPALKRLLIKERLEYSSFNLFYCSSNIREYKDNGIRMVDEVYEMLKSLGMSIENFTAMDSTSKEERTALITHLKKEIIDGLVAIRCLDEGVDIPDVKRAFILSSSSNPKEFIQRRGRVLRKADGKEFAEIYDFLVVPFGYDSEEEYRANRKYLEKELKRYREFAKLALNYPSCEKELIDIMSEYRLLHI